MKQELLDLFEKAKADLKVAIDDVAADAPNYLEALASVAEKHAGVQAVAKVLAAL